MKILITNVVMLNTGDAAILTGLINILRKTFGHDIEFAIYDSQPAISSEYYPELKFQRGLYLNRRKFERIKPLKSLLQRLYTKYYLFSAWCWGHGLKWLGGWLLSKAEKQDLQEYVSADLIVSTGGTYLVENYSLEKRIFDYQVSQALNRPLIFFTQSLGPFLQPYHQQKFRRIFDQASLILVRDKASLHHIKAIAAHARNVHISADAAFALARLDVLQASPDQPFPKGPRLRVAISVREWSHFQQIDPELGMQRYENSIRAAVQYLVETHQAEIVFLSTCQGIPEYWTDDSKVALAIAQTLPDSVRQHVVVDRQFHSPTELMELLASFDLVIATRMHMAILSLDAGTPVLPIAYEFKTKELFDRLKLGQWTHDIETIEPVAFTQSVSAFLQDIPDIRKTLVPGVLAEHQQALAAGAIVQQTFEQG